MKRISILLLLAFMSFSSCDWDDVPEETPLTILAGLTSATQRNFAVFAATEATLFGSITMQQVSGISGRMLHIEQYQWLPGYFDQSWRVCYLGVFSNLTTAIELATQNNLGKYRGTSKILLAHTLGIASDLWGDIPFSDSFDSRPPSLNPRYDSQQAIYERIFRLLDEGIQDVAAYGSEFFPAEDDLFFNGNALMWTRYANFLKLRYRLHLLDKNGIEPVFELLQNNMFTNPGQALVLDYGTMKVQNPLNQLLDQFPGQVRAGGFLVDLLQGQNDPRLPVYFQKNVLNQFLGSAPGAGNANASRISETINSAGSKVILASYTEQMFIAAEVYYRKGLMNQARQALSEAVSSSLTDYNVYNAAWVQNHLATTGLTLENIMLAKYSALFMQTQSWNDWRRTGLPLLQAAAGNQTSGLIPRRFPYPLNELTHNPNNVPANVKITDPVWWNTQSK